MIELIEALAEYISQTQPITIGQLPPRAGAAMIQTGGQVEPYMNGDALNKIALTIWGKAASQAEAESICCKAVKAALLFKADNVTGISVKGLPAAQGQSSDGMWYYSWTIEVRAYFHG